MSPELLLAFPAVKKVVDAVRYLADGQVVQWRELGIVAASWVAGIGTVALVAASSFAAELGLAEAGLADIALWGIVVGSSAGVIHDLKDGVHVE